MTRPAPAARCASISAGLCLLLCACTTSPESTTGAYRPAPTPPRFRAMHRMLSAARADADRGDAAALRGRSADLVEEGLALIKANLPHDVKRPDVPRYLEGRAAFGDALKRWAAAVEGPDDAALFAALDRLDGATRAWIDAYLGLAPETSV